MHTALILKKMRMNIKKQGIGSAIKMLVGQIIWIPLYPILVKLYLKRPISKKQILFISKPDYSDNAYFLFEYLKSHREFGKYSYIWLVDSNEQYEIEDKYVSFCNKYSKWHVGLSMKALKAVLTSEYIFFTHASPLHKLTKRSDQNVINLWHGCGYKSIKSTNQWEKENPFDYALVPGKIFIETKSVFWACAKEKILTIGYPRYDEFKNVSSSTQKMFSHLKGEAKKLIIWMPTYRKTELEQFAVSKIQGFFELPILESEDDLIKLDNYCTDAKTVICIKRHHYQLRYQCENLELKSIRFIDDSDISSADASLYGLLACVDGLVTDYSSVAIDFMLVDKPIGFTLNDFHEYGDTQGFVFNDPLKYMPGDHIFTFNDFIDFVNEIVNDEDRHREDRLSIMGEVHNPCDCYCERICDYFCL